MVSIGARSRKSSAAVDAIRAATDRGGNRGAVRPPVVATVHAAVGAAFRAILIHEDRGEFDLSFHLVPCGGVVQSGGKCAKPVVHADSRLLLFHLLVLANCDSPLCRLALPLLRMRVRPVLLHRRPTNATARAPPRSHRARPPKCSAAIVPGA